MTGEVGWFLHAMKEKLASPLEQELFHDSRATRSMVRLVSSFIDSTHPVNPRRLASGASGRTSTAPSDAPGQRAAHSRAALMEGSSSIMNPANCSLVSAYGPSCTRRFPSLRRTVVAVSTTSSASAPTYTLASTSAL